MAIIFGLGGMASAGDSMAEPYKEITAPEVRTMIEKDNVVMVHVLSKIAYDIQHIPGSINVPINRFKTTDKLPKEKDTPQIFY